MSQVWRYAYEENVVVQQGNTVVQVAVAVEVVVLLLVLVVVLVAVVA
jgi:hypothetical protein